MPAMAETEGPEVARRIAHLAELESEAEAIVERLRRLEEEYQARLPQKRLGRLLKWVLGVRLGNLVHHAPRPLRVPARYHRRPELSDPPVISIVTPSYQQGSFLEQTLSSVLEQDYPRLEYVVQDGGSRDGTVELLRRHEARLSAWESRPDGGQAHALNLGFGRTTGAIMAYLNADDLLLPGTLHYVADYFHRHPEIDAVYGHRVIIDREGMEVGRWLLPPHQDEVVRFVDYVPQETLFWRRSLWERAGGMVDESFHFALDWDLILRLQDAGARFARLPRFLGAFRVHDLQKTSTQLATTGRSEMSRLRQRCHGRDLGAHEVRNASLGYLLRSGLCFRLYQLGLARY